jgi:hypothetical protein
MTELRSRVPGAFALTLALFVCAAVQAEGLIGGCKNAPAERPT